MLSFEEWFIRQHATIPVASAKAVLALSVGGATLPFIARYRKEQTGNLDEVAIQTVLDAKETWDAVLHRKKFICDEIEKQGKLTPDLKEPHPRRVRPPAAGGSLLAVQAETGRPARRWRARPATREPLAEWMWRVSHEDNAERVSLDEKAATFVSPERNVATREQAIEGARDIVVERLSESADLRERVRS